MAASSNSRNTRSALHRSLVAGMLIVLLSSCVNTAPAVAPTTTVSTIAEPAPAVSPTPAAQAGAPDIGDPGFPGLGNGGYDAQHYTLELTIDTLPDWNVPPIAAVVTMTAQAGQDLSAFNLDFQEFSIDAVTVNGQNAGYHHAARELTITPTAALALGSVFTTTVRYHGVPEPSSYRIKGSPHNGTTAIGWNRYRGGTFVFGVPSGASTWFPVNDHPRDKATYRFRITAPKPYVVAANGLLLGVDDHGESATYHWEARDPIASYLVTVNIADQVLETAVGPNNLPIRNYFPPDLTPERKATFSRTAEMIALFNERFGPYPFEAYGVVVADSSIDAFLAMEHQTLPLFSNDSEALTEAIVVHELAHQWFGNSVSLHSWQDIWLKEGFARYAEWLWIEHTQGRAAFQTLVREVYAEPEQPWEKYPLLAEPTPANLISEHVYARGALTVQALRHRVGDDTFFRIVHTYTERFRNQSASTADFIALAEEVSGQDLEAFFDAWLYTKQIPPLAELGVES